MNNITTTPDNHPQAKLDFSSHEQTRPDSSPMWLCIYLPNLAAHSLAIDIHSSKPTVIYKANTKDKRIFYVSPVAEQFGLEVNMPLSQAQQLCVDVEAYARRPLKEKALIRSIAHGMIALSPVISVKYDSSILIASEHTENKLDELHHLQRSISANLKMLGFPHSITSSPVPLASLLLAKAKRNVTLCNNDALRSELNSLEITDFLIDQDNLIQLHNLGIQRGDQLFRLLLSNNMKHISLGLYTYLNELLGINNNKTTLIQRKFSPNRNFH